MCFICVSLPPPGLLLPDPAREDHLRPAWRDFLGDLHAAVPPTITANHRGLDQRGFRMTDVCSGQWEAEDHMNRMRTAPSAAVMEAGHKHTHTHHHTHSVELFALLVTSAGLLSADHEGTCVNIVGVILPEMSQFLPSSVKQSTADRLTSCGNSWCVQTSLPGRKCCCIFFFFFLVPMGEVRSLVSLLTVHKL